ncbi:MAG: hypothetical protein NTX64_05490 [Elusimicrobia bacterium]|nr:hypothetical protein [Elusimicrobiota bacterium]
MTRFLLFAAIAALLPLSAFSQDSGGHGYVPCVGGSDAQRGAGQSKVDACGIEYGNPDYSAVGSGGALGIRTRDHYETVPPGTVDSQYADIEALTKSRAAQLDLTKQKALDASLNAQLSQVTQDLQATQSQLSATQSQLSSLQASQQRLAAALAADQAATEQAKGRVQADEAGLQTVGGQIADLQSKVAQSADETASYQARLDDANTQKASLQDRQASDQAAADGASGRVQNDNAQIQTLNGQIADLQARIAQSASDTEKQRLQGQLDQVNGQKAAVQNQLAADQGAFDQAKARVQSDGAQLQAIGAQIADLQAKAAHSAANTDNYRAQLAQANGQQAALQNQLAADQAAVTNGTAKINKGYSDLSATQSSIDTTNNNLSTLSGKANNTAAQQASLQAQIAGVEAAIQNDMSVPTLGADKTAATQHLMDCGVPIQRCVPFDQSLRPRIDDILSNVDAVQQANSALQAQATKAGVTNATPLKQAQQAVQAFFQAIPREYATAADVQNASARVAAMKTKVDGQLGAAWLFTRDASTPTPASPDDKMKGGSAADPNKPGNAPFDSTRMARLSEVGGIKIADAQGSGAPGGPREPAGWFGLNSAPDASLGAGGPAEWRRGVSGPRPEGVDSSFRSAEQALWLARKALASGDYETAEREAREAVQRDPKSVAAWKALTRALIARKKYLEAVEAATRALTLAPKDAALWALRAYAKDASGDIMGALADITHAAELDARFEALARFAKSGGRLSSRGIGEFDLMVEGLPGGWLFLGFLAVAGFLALLFAFWLRRRRERKKAAAAEAAAAAGSPPQGPPSYPV